MTICYFTATGNSLYVAKRIGGELRSIPKLMWEDRPTISDDAVGVVCPVYCGEMPGMVRRFLLKAEIRTDYFFFVYTYGMSETFAKPHAAALAKQADLPLRYVNSIKMVDNFLPGFEMQNQKETAGEKRIEEQIHRVCQDIALRKVSTVPVGVVRKIGMALVHGTMGKTVLKGTAAKSYLVTDDCIQCGVCARYVPPTTLRSRRRWPFPTAVRSAMPACTTVRKPPSI